ncbi:VOC family protein [Sphingoaurantiacus capsulatus]|uniref:VOC family protein n=1 Tax=Sphingoaurantiacus capsulatus TaxID=1771310 RepID=A0ABV7XB41_9SPHN
MSIAKISPSFWYAKEAEEAAKLYVSLFPNSRIDRTTTMPTDTPSGPPGSVVVVEFTLDGQSFTAMSAGPLDPFNHAISFTINCADQAEIDHYWDGFLSAGGTTEQCGWLKDKFGVCWQVVPVALNDMMASPDRAAAKRAADAMLKMVKLDLAALQAAFDGKA